MKKLTTSVILRGALVLLPFPLHAQTESVSLAVTNPLDEKRHSETVEVSWPALLGAAPGLNPVTVSVFDGAARVVTQTLDLDGDGRTDILVFQSDFAPREVKTFTVGDLPAVRQIPSSLDARFVLPRQDLAWENDRIAFRIYGSVLAGDVNSGIDVWTKRVRYPVVAKWYGANEYNAGGKDSYHEDRGEGADFFSVGKSLGAGGCGVFLGGRVHQSGLFTSHRIVATGPVRALFEVRYDSAAIGATRFREVRRISLDAGQNLNRIEVRYYGFPPAETLAVAAGIVKRSGVNSAADPRGGWAALWGATNNDPVNGSLGTAVVMSRDFFRAIREDSTHLLILGAVESDRPVRYLAGAGWTRSGDFSSQADWESYVARQARFENSPLRVAIGGVRR